MLTPDPVMVKKEDLSKAQLKILWYQNEGWSLHYNCLGLGRILKGGESHKAGLPDIYALMRHGLVYRSKGSRDYGDYELTPEGAPLPAQITEADFTA